MKVYISSSWKNRDKVRELAVMIRESGHEVYDFTDPSCRKTREIPPEKFPEQFDPEKYNYREYIDRPEWLMAVMENRDAIIDSDLIILLLPCGVDATADWALGVGMGKPSIVIGHPKSGERSPVHLWASVMVDDIKIIPALLHYFENATCDQCNYNEEDPEDKDFKNCDCPGFIPDEIFDKFGDEELPKHCGFFTPNIDINLKCRVCGCSELNACPGECSWVKPGLCSQCVDKEKMVG